MMNQENDGETRPRFMKNILISCLRFVSFFNLYARYRKKHPKKGSLNWVFKVCSELNTLGHEIAIKDGKSSIKLKSGRYTESFDLKEKVILHFPDDVHACLRAVYDQRPPS